MRLITTTSGESADIDVDGYDVVAVGLPSPYTMTANDTVILPVLPTGPYTLELTNIAPNCAAIDGDTKSIVVAPRSTVDATWTINCGLIPSSLDLSFTPIAPSGAGAASITIDGGTPYTLPAGMTKTFDPLPPGRHTIAIIGGTPNCQFTPPLIHQITLVRSVRAQLTLTGACSGGRVLFDLMGILWMMNADTSNRHEISLPPGVLAAWAALSADGARIAFIGPNSQLYVMRSDGTELRPIATAPVNAKELVWSPDDSQIAFSGGSPALNDYEIFVINADGSNLRNLTNDAARDEGPTWSPDGDRIAFTSDRAGGTAPFTERLQVFSMKSDGSDVLPVSGPDGFYPDWAADGSAIAFSHSGLLSLMETDGSNVRGIPGVSSYLNYPRWSPDSRMLVASGGTEIHFIAKDGGSTMVAVPDYARYVSWSK